MAGVAGGILIEFFLYFVNTGYSWAGMAGYLLASIVWGIAYAYAAQSLTQLTARPLVSGLVFGAIVYFTMQIVLLASGLRGQFGLSEVVLGVIGHCIFFGLPVAFTVSRTSRNDD